ncbi:MAG TPA: transcriptional regulator [Synechococcales bacterium UBA10510]|nr:transcriptional regulator [Synechococcales bacterium UBA10510]
MASPEPADLTAPRPPLPARLLRWWRRRSLEQGQLQPPAVDPLIAAGLHLRQQREAQGLSLRDLARDTRISTPVLEALERGWRDRLPEPAYLRTMLPLIERQLQLRPGCLDPLLPESAPLLPGPRRDPLLSRFTPGSIEVFSSWQGTVLYGLLILALIYGLNLSQQRLAAAGLLTLRPIPPLPPSEQLRPARPELALLAALPELRPLDQRGSQLVLRQLLADLRANRQLSPAASSSADKPGRVAAGNGLLSLQLQQVSRVRLKGAQGLRSDLQGITGNLELNLAPGFELQIEPPPLDPAQVVWNGTPLQPLPGQAPGRYRLAPAVAPAAAAP